ncbi:DMT family transporter [Azospirillum picis]|uniref:Drug/metabolite transporter (DMT)-like permease n=1 Tax=Azospirillum picis TaxID=488438 RepID=A0ABU0MHJ6_9PROT|nr:DMT family transporter [Azospirillum picis]MBP2298875.1 drug/metabolite transporter (DMT)-like permease [Azospirillum picis]MDQ0532883.1 drug/metabolite transporter (DMT)-like permease [Azospirillum picis]
MPTPFRSGPLAAYSLYLTGSALLAANPVVGRAAASLVPPVGLAFWRWLIAFLIVLPFALPGLLAHRHRLRADWKRYLLLGVLGQGISGAVVYYGLQRTSATNASLIYATSPAMILALAAVWLGDAIRSRQVLGILLAMTGVLAILARGDLEALLRLSFNGGDLLVLAGAVSWSVYTILLRQSGAPLPVVTAFAANALAGVLVLAPFYAWETVAVRSVPFTTATVLSIVGVALFASVLALLAYQKTIEMMGAARASTALYVSPLWAALASWQLLSEPLQGFHLVGVLLVLPGVTLATLPARGPVAPAAAEAG